MYMIYRHISIGTHGDNTDIEEKKMKKILLRHMSAAPLFALLFIMSCGVCVTVPPVEGGELKGVGGLEAEPPVPAELGNALVNPGFEEGTTGWNVGRCFSVDKTVAHSGSSSMRFNMADGCGSVRQLDVKLNATGYTIRGWIKTENIGNGVPRVSAFDSTHGGYVGATIVGPTGTNGWKRFEVADTSRLAGHRDDSMELRLYSVGVKSGTIWFDDIEFVPTAPLLNVFVMYPNFRGYLWDDGNQIVRAAIEVNPPQGGSLKDYEAEVSVLDSTTMSAIDVKYMPSLQGINIFRWDASAMPVDTEALIRVTLKSKVNGGVVSTYPDYRIVKKSAQFRAGLNNWVDENNTLIHGGQPRFVWGVYDRMSGARCTGCLGTTASYYESIRGFDGLSTLDNYKDTKSNTVLYFSPMSGANPGVPYKSKDQITPWVEALRSRGAMHLQITNNLFDTSTYRPSWARNMTEEEIWNAIGTMITDPGFLGYYVADEPDLFKTPTLSEVFRQYAVLKSVNKGSITFEVFSQPAHIERWRDTADVMGFDVYPLGGGPLPDDRLYGDGTPPYFGRVDLWAVEAGRAAKWSRPVWAVLQLFNSRGEFPKYGDMKKMAWKPIIAGAKGILWWGFVSTVGMESRWYGPYQSNAVPPYDPDAYPDYKRISTEVTALEPELLSNNVWGLVTSNDDRIRFIVKQASSSPFSYYVIATNLTNETIAGASFTAGYNINKVDVYSEDRSIFAQGATWTDDFKGHDVHVYRIDLNGLKAR